MRKAAVIGGGAAAIKAIVHAARGIVGGGKGRHGQRAEDLCIPGA